MELKKIVISPNNKSAIKFMNSLSEKKNEMKKAALHGVTTLKNQLQKK